MEMQAGGVEIFKIIVLISVSKGTYTVTTISITQTSKAMF